MSPRPRLFTLPIAKAMEDHGYRPRGDPGDSLTRRYAEQVNTRAELDAAEEFEERQRARTERERARRIDAEASRAEAEGRRETATTLTLEQRLKQREFEFEQDVQDVMEIEGVSRRVAERILGRRRGGALLPPGMTAEQADVADRQTSAPVSDVERFFDMFTKVRSFEREISDEIAAKQAQLASPTTTPAERRTLAGELQDMMENLASVGQSIKTVGPMFGMVDASQQRGDAPIAPSPEVGLVLYRGVGNVPATTAQVLYATELEHRRELRKIELQAEGEQHKWKTLASLNETGARLLSPENLGQILFALTSRDGQQVVARPEQPAPAQVRAPAQQEQQQQEDGILTIACPGCGEPSLFATQAMIDNGQPATCTACKSTFELRRRSDVEREQSAVAQDPEWAPRNRRQSWAGA